MADIGSDALTGAAAGSVVPGVGSQDLFLWVSVLVAIDDILLSPDCLTVLTPVF